MLSLLTVLLACGDKETEVVAEPTAEPSADTNDCMVGRDPEDMDCDGFSEEDGDCDDSTALVYPGAPEIPYDGRDNDCAGDGDLNDLDQDGYIGNSADGGDDCDDNNADVYPGAAEVCYDGIDQDCAGDVELENNNDCDGDGHIGRGEDATDCDDTNALVNPEAEEIWYDGFDQNCDMQDDFDQDGDGDPIAEIDVDGDGVLEETWDATNDGFLEYDGGTDCDDMAPLTSPTFSERWDGVDRDCDGIIDGMVARDAFGNYKATSGVEGGLGMSSAVIGDITGDGIAEVIVGAPYSFFDSTQDPDSGAITQENYDGAAFVLDPTDDGSPNNVKVAHVKGGVNSYSYLGWDMVSLGDIDGGGLNDIVIGSPGNSKAYLYMGESFTQGATLLLADANTNMQAVGFGGVDVANAGDCTGDGLPEVAVGGSFVYSSDGAWVGVYDGADVLAGGALGYTDALFTIDSSTGTAIGGETVGDIDFDGDGLMDMAVAWGISGTGNVAMVSGADIANGGSITHADLNAVTGTIGTEFGRHNASAVDINGDTLGELVVSAGYSDSTMSDGTVNQNGGIVYVFNGDVLQTGGTIADAYIEIHGSEIASNIQVIDQLGDNDGDGLTDVIVAGVNDDFVTNQPDVVTYMFRATSLNSGGTFDASSAGSSIWSNQDVIDLFGYGGTSDDIDGDGDDDLLLGAPRTGYQIGLGGQNFDGLFAFGNFVILEADLNGQ